MASKSTVLAVFLLLSCSSLQSKEEWHETPVAMENRNWRWCASPLDKPQYWDKGWCWKGEEVWRRKWPFSDKVRAKPYFCAFADVACMKLSGLDRKRLVTP